MYVCVSGWSTWYLPTVALYLLGVFCVTLYVYVCMLVDGVPG